jgi:arylsulfatase A
MVIAVDRAASADSSMHSSIAALFALTAVAPGLSAATASAAPPSSSRPPNIILFLADDYGIDGVSCYGADGFKTPAMDALAKRGVRFENCYAAPLCGPSRCLLMTGRYAFRTGGLSNQSWTRGTGAKSAGEYPIARLLAEHGYATCQVGKWRQIGETPRNWGFQEYVTDPTAGGYYWQTSYTRNGEIVRTNQETYMPDVVHHYAIDFITRHRDGPFFLYYATHLVHNPILRTPDTKPGTTGREKLYVDNVAYLDKQLGDLIARLEELGLRDNTVIIFSGDNGTAQESGTVGGRQVFGHKGQMLEGGSRVPLIAAGPGIAPTAAPLKDLVDFSDFYATAAELAGVGLPKGPTFDSRSFAARLHGEKGNPREWVFVELGRNWYVRDAGWKLTRQGALLDLSDAPFAEKPIDAAKAAPEADAARTRLQAVLAQLDPASGKTEDGDGRGMQDGKKKKQGNQKKKRAAPGV